MANLTKNVTEKSAVARADRRVTQGIVQSVNLVTHEAMLDVGHKDTQGNPVYLSVPFQPQSPPQVGYTASVVYASNSPHSGMIASSQLGGTGPGTVITSSGAVSSLNTAQGDLTLATGAGLTLARVGGTFTVSLAGGKLFVNTADSTAISNTVAEIDFSLDFVLQANGLAVGTALRITAAGTYADTGTPTLDLRLKFGATTIFDLGAVTLGSGVTGKQWRAEWLVVCRAVGGSGSVKAELVQAALDGAALALPPATTTVDTTVTQQIQISAQWSAAATGNTTTQTLLLIEMD